VPQCLNGAAVYASGVHCIKVVEDVAVKKFVFAISSSDEFLVDLDD